MKTSARLLVIKALHTIAWAFFATCIIALPIAAHAMDFHLASLLIGLVLIEVIILAFNRWRCPLTDIATRYTDAREDNFDIFLPRWLARHNKLIFGGLFILGLGYTGYRWWLRMQGA